MILVGPHDSVVNTATRLICISILPLLIVACDKGNTFVVHGMEDGYKRDYGQGFYGIDRVYKDSKAWEGYEYTRDLYYRGLKLDRAGYAKISPSGRFAIYESELYGGILVFDSRDRQIYRLKDKGPMPDIEHWDNEERQLTVKYYAQDGNHSQPIQIDVTTLRRIGSLASSPEPASERPR